MVAARGIPGAARAPGSPGRRPVSPWHLPTRRRHDVTLYRARLPGVKRSRHISRERVRPTFPGILLATRGFLCNDDHGCGNIRQTRRVFPRRIGGLLQVRRHAMSSNVRTIWVVVVRVAAWAWALIAGVGGLALLIHQGPLPITNGWFAMFSGLAACPLTASLLRKYAHVTVPGYVQFAIALLIFIAGRVAVTVVLQRPFLPQ